MILSSVLTPILILLRYPRFHKGVCGPHADIGAHTLRIPDSTQCQVFYPASPSNKKSSHHPYFRAEAVEGLADFLQKNKNKRLLNFLNARRHPCLIDATPKTTTDTTHHDEKRHKTGGRSSPPSSFPVVVFSHGLGGSLEMYTQLCRNLASHGFIVFAMEHEDGSASFARSGVDGKRIYYDRPDNTPYSKDKVLKFRGPMYEKRIGEVKNLLDYLYSLRTTGDGDGAGSNVAGSSRNTIVGDGDYDESNALLATHIDQTLASLMAVADLSSGVSLLGHSFGGTTVALAQQRFQSSTIPPTPTSTSTTPIIKSVAVLDPWCFSLPDQSLNQGVSTTPLLSVLSARWGHGPESSAVRRFLKNSDVGTLTSLYAPRSVHQSFSDTYCWLPGFVSRRMGMRGRGEGMHDTCWAVADVCARFFNGDVVGSARGGKGDAVEEDGTTAVSGKTLLPFPIL